MVFEFRETGVTQQNILLLMLPTILLLQKLLCCLEEIITWQKSRSYLSFFMLMTYKILILSIFGHSAHGMYTFCYCECTAISLFWIKVEVKQVFLLILLMYFLSRSLNCCERKPTHFSFINTTQTFISNEAEFRLDPPRS